MTNAKTLGLGHKLSFSQLSIIDLLEVPHRRSDDRYDPPNANHDYNHEDRDTKSFMATVDCVLFPKLQWIDEMVLLSLKVFLFSVIYHLVEEKTSKSITGFDYSWYITFFELSSAFCLEFLERASLNAYNISMTVSSVQKSFQWCYILLSFNLIFSRGFATIVLQYYDMDYPTYAICRNSKMLFVMFLSVIWLRKSYQIQDWVLVLLTSLSVVCFRLASHDVWFSSANTMGVPLLLLSTFLSAMDNSWKEKITSQSSLNVSANDILFNINLFAILTLFVFITFVSSEYLDATMFLFDNPSAFAWMLLRGTSYALWIHYSVLLIEKCGALVNQYVSAVRKLISVIFSFLFFKKPFYMFHLIGFLLFATACGLKLYRSKHTFENIIKEQNAGNNNKNNTNHNENEKEERRVLIEKTNCKIVDIFETNINSPLVIDMPPNVSTSTNFTPSPSDSSQYLDDSSQMSDMV